MLPLNTSASPARASAAASGRRVTTTATRRTTALVGGALVATVILLVMRRSSETGSRPLLNRGGAGGSEEQPTSSAFASHAPPAKQGAGLVLWRPDSDSVLLLQRRSKHHDRAWGLPGGNVEPGDLSLLDAAEREATEEMGSLPGSFSVLTRIDTVRGGKNKEKAYSAFVLRVPGEMAESYSPVLNKESRAWRWVRREEAFRLTGGEGGGSRGGGSGSAGNRKKGGGASASSSFVLHPVAADLLTPGTQSRALLDEAVSAAVGGEGNATGGDGGGGGGEG